jgi:FtsP/CotA-like multicopper oxidase with cupredoxin domain
MSENRTKEGRREFLKGALLSGGAAVVAAASRGVVASEPESAPAPEPEAKPKGYRVTDHVQQYYKTAQF